MNIYEATPFNENYQYFNMKQKTMPNGLGQGGQLEYFAYWIDRDVCFYLFYLLDYY